MGNMSYCRFENTVNDMRDCINAIEERDVYDLSDYEVKALEKFLTLAHEITSMEPEIEQIINYYEPTNSK